MYVCTDLVCWHTAHSFIIHFIIYKRNENIIALMHAIMMLGILYTSIKVTGYKQWAWQQCKFFGVDAYTTINSAGALVRKDS